MLSRMIVATALATGVASGGFSIVTFISSHSPNCLLSSIASYPNAGMAACAEKVTCKRIETHFSRVHQEDGDVFSVRDGVWSCVPLRLDTIYGRDRRHAPW